MGFILTMNESVKSKKKSDSYLMSEVSITFYDFILLTSENFYNLQFKNLG